MAMASSSSRPAPARFARLWQLPLFLLSLGLFGYAAYLFIDPKPGLTIDQKIDLARTFVKYDRPEAAIDQLNKLLGGEKLTLENQSKIHLMLAESIELAQKLKKLDLPVNHERIIEQSQIALSQGVKPEAEIYRRLGESYEALGQSEEALKNYRRAEAMDVNRSLRLKRKVIELQIAQGDAAAAEASLDEYRADTKITDGERAWALGEKSHLLVDAGKFIEARALLGEALRLSPDPTVQGQLHYWLGYSQWKLGNSADAERLLRVARDLLKTAHPADAEAAYALGKICREKGDFKEAKSFFESVLISHPDSPLALLAKLGRGMCRVSLAEDEAGLHDLQATANEVAAKASQKKKISEIVAGIRDSATTLATRENFQGALEAMSYEQLLTPTPAAEFFARLATVYEKRSDQIDKSIVAAANADERFRQEQRTRETRIKAGDAYIAYAKALGVSEGDDKAYGDAIWKAVDLYDRCGSLPLSIAALELFANERPDDSLAPEAWLRLGRAYQAAGDFDKAITSLQRNQYRYPNSLAASKSGVPLAQAYIAKGPDSYAKAETTLKAVIESNPLITPDAEEFRQGLFELAQLYYRTERFEEAGGRLEELTERYADDKRMAQLLFLRADSYRKSASLIRTSLAAKRAATAEAKLAAAKQGPAADKAAKDEEAVAAGAALDDAGPEAALKDRLTRAGEFYARVVDRFHDTKPETDSDKLYVKLSHFYRADCFYDLGDFKSAIKLYDTAAQQYQKDPSALTAYVQIVNSYYALGMIDEAKAATERTKWLLRQMPEEAFQDGRVQMSKQYWEQWLKWTNDAGMFGPSTAIAGNESPAAP
jgi:tetratricopeptide (TPR) repeat protein